MYSRFLYALAFGLKVPASTSRFSLRPYSRSLSAVIFVMADLPIDYDSGFQGKAPCERGLDSGD